MLLPKNYVPSHASGEPSTIPRRRSAIGVAYFGRNVSERRRHFNRGTTAPNHGITLQHCPLHSWATYTALSHYLKIILDVRSSIGILKSTIVRITSRKNVGWYSDRTEASFRDEPFTYAELLKRLNGLKIVSDFAHLPREAGPRRAIRRVAVLYHTKKQRRHGGGKTTSMVKSTAVASYNAGIIVCTRQPMNGPWNPRRACERNRKPR